MSWWLRQIPPSDLVRKARGRAIPIMMHLHHCRVRICGACLKRTLFVACGEGEEFHLCIRCRANLRYELLASYLRSRFPDVTSLDILELDDRSPLRGYLGAARSYARSFYRDGVSRGFVRADGVRCEDITRLTYPDASLDLIVSSDVLEHVPDVSAALQESTRVLRPGGVHVFTVPPRDVTRKRAEMVAGRISHLLPPEYHRDPLDRKGILTYWDFGPDLPQRLSTETLRIRLALGPVGTSHRMVWEAQRIEGGARGR